ncbi:protein pufQ [Aliigemmobacter aestuarii]|uniref:Protein pufQ n=1 Tax=Aliigemmobacter aestuarii TaxID=1445661 RepID=A0A4S3MUG8_9RHOB|nr:cytochrome PufQ [Gemmobacter aestuarii]THD85575.1 protein pufQ [Gemmobacter aestuarii]
MSDHSISSHDPFEHAHRKRTPKAEYATYFALILCFALPVQALVWTWSLIRHRRLPAVGPLARALRDAEEITPAIFRP